MKTAAQKEFLRHQRQRIWLNTREREARKFRIGLAICAALFFVLTITFGVIP